MGDLVSFSKKMVWQYMGQAFHNGWIIRESNIARELYQENNQEYEKSAMNIMGS